MIGISSVTAFSNTGDSTNQIAGNSIIGKDSLFHSGEIVISSRDKHNSLGQILGSPFVTGLVGIIATLGGFLVNDYLNRRNLMRTENTKLLADISKTLILYGEYSNDLYGQTMWVDFYNAAVRNNIQPIPDDRVRILERMDKISDQMKQLKGELFGLFNQFELRLGKSDQELYDLAASFYDSLTIDPIDFGQFDDKGLRGLSKTLHIGIKEATDSSEGPRIVAINNLVDFIIGKIGKRGTKTRKI